MTIDVTHLITGLDVGGAETQLAMLVARSDASRFRHRVISLRSPGKIAEQILASGIVVHSLRMDGGLPDLRALNRLMRQLRRDRPGVLQSWMYHANLVASLVGPLARVPVVWNMRAVPDVDHGRHIAVIDAVLARICRLPAVVVSNSQHGREYQARHGYSAARWQIIPNGFDVERFRPDPQARRDLRSAWGISDEQPLIGLVARLDPVKDHPTFLDAARRLLNVTPNVRFICAGSGPEHYERKLRDIATSYGLSDAVIWAGARSDTWAVNNALDVATCASLSESFPNVVGEAMACGTPCVVTDVGDAAHLVGNAGLVIQPRDSAALAEAWESLVTIGPAQREIIGERARARIQQHFSIDRVVNEYESLYASLVSHR